MVSFLVAPSGCGTGGRSIPYCPYTNTNLDDDDSNPDHVVPLSLGGVNGFEVASDARFNAHAGSKIEGPIVNDPLFALARRDADARGHNNKPPVPVWKYSVLNAQPVQVSLGNTIKVWDCRRRVYLTEEEAAGAVCESTWKIDKYAAIQLTAKIAIGTCYFLGGLKLLDAIEIEALRWLARTDLSAAQAAGPDALPEIAAKLTVWDRFHPNVAPSGPERMWSFATEFTGRSTIILRPFRNGLAVHVGLLGMYLGTVVTEAQHQKLEAALPCDLGLVLLLAPGTLERSELRDFLKLSLAALADDPSAPQPTPT